MDDEVMTDDEQDYLADNGTLSIELNDANIATSSGVSERFSNHSAKTNVLTPMLTESLNQNMPEDGPASMTQFSILLDDDTDDSTNNAEDSKMAYQSSMNNNVNSGQSVAQNGEDRDEKFCAQENTLPKVGSERKEQEKGEKEKRRGSREEPEDGEILEDGEIASEEDDLFFGKRPRDDDECSEKSASSPEEAEMKSEASDNEVENVEAEKPEELRRERRKRKRERREKRRKKNEAKRKRKRLEYVDHDQVNDEYNWNLSSKNRSPSGPYDSPSDKQSSSPYRSPPGPYESPPGLYDSPSEDDNDEGCGPKLVNLIGDNFMDLAVAATEKEDLFKPREKKRGGKKSKRSHHHHSSKKKPLLETPRQRTMCKFFKEGKCSKADDCPYSHDFKPSKKTEICKFYLNSICTKGDNCLFLHGEYPCKFYHTGAQCYQGEKCKFSHEPLNDETKILLEKILEHRDEDSSDDDSSREDGSNGKKIPSLFDIKVYPPGQSPKKSAGSSGSQSVRPGFYKDSLSSSPSGNSSCSMPPSGSGMGGLGQLRPNIGSPGHPSFLGPRQTPSDCPTQQQSPPQHGCSPPHPQPSGPPGTNYSDNDNTSQPQDSLHHPLYHPMHYHHHHGIVPDERHNSEGEKVEERKPVPIEIPSHLPPRQKELFLRIHQQQHLLAAKEATEIKNDMKVDDDNWYSSDEDEDGEAKPKLADILKNLNKQPPKPPPSNFSPSQSNNQQGSGANSALNIMQMINAIRGQPTPASGGPPPVASGGTTTISTTTSTTTTTTATIIVPGSSGSSSVASRRDPRRQAQKGNVSTEPKAMSSPATKQADPRLQSGKATTSVLQEIVPPRIPTPPIPVINAIPPGELLYRLYEVSTNKLPLSATVDVFDPRFKNDPRVQKFLSNPPECLKQKAGSLETDKMLKSLVVPNPNRIDDMSNTVIQPPPTLPATSATTGLPPALLRPPQDPRLLRAVPQNSRILGKKSDDKDSQETTKPVDPRLMRGGNDQKSFDPRLSRQQSNAIPAGNVRYQDHRILRQQDAKNPPSRLSGDPRAVRQQSPVREPSLPTLLLPPLPNANAQSGNSGNPRGPRPPIDQQKFGPRGSIPPNRPNNPRSMRPENQNKNTDQNESQNTDSTQPKLDHRNDPRFKRKPAADSNNSQPPLIRKFIGQRKGSMEYSSPLGVEMDKPEHSSGYNSYNRPPNANRQMGSGNKSRTSGADIAPPNLAPSSGNPPLPPVSSDPLQSDPREMSSHSELSGVPPSGFPPQMPQTGPNLPYQAMPPPDQPKLKDLFKTIDPTASPFC